MTIGDRIRIKREELSLSQTDLAKKAGYNDRTSISKFEHAGDDISMKQVKRVAKALGVSAAYLMGWEEQSKDKAINDLLELIPSEIINDSELYSQIIEFITIFLSLSPEVRTAFLQTLRGLKS